MSRQHRGFKKVFFAQRLDEGHDLFRQFLGDAGDLGAQNLQFAFGVGVTDPMVKTAPLKSVVHFTGAIEVTTTIGG